MTDLSNLPQEVRTFVKGLDFALLQHSDDALVGVGNIRVGDYRAFRAELLRLAEENAVFRQAWGDALMTGTGLLKIERIDPASVRLVLDEAEGE